jgi:hypothetical protein
VQAAKARTQPRTSAPTFLRGSTVARNATQGRSPRPRLPATRARSSASAGAKTPASTPCRATSRRPGSAPVSRTTSSRVATDGTTQRAARRTARRVAVRNVAALTGRCTPGSVKKVASCSVTTLAAPGRAGAV